MRTVCGGALATDADNDYAMIDSTIVRAHQHSAGAPQKEEQTIGPSKGGLSTKIHAAIDALGNPTGLHLTPGQACDLEGADQLLAAIAADIVIADKGYDAEAGVVEPLKSASKTAVAPPRHNRRYPGSYDRHLYKARRLIENFFCKL